MNPGYVNVKLQILSWIQSLPTIRYVLVFFDTILVTNRTIWVYWSVCLFRRELFWFLETINFILYLLDKYIKVHHRPKEKWPSLECNELILESWRIGGHGLLWTDVLLKDRWGTLTYQFQCIHGQWGCFDWPILLGNLDRCASIARILALNRAELGASGSTYRIAAYIQIQSLLSHCRLLTL